MVTEPENQEPIHEWFELSGSNYLVLPRSVLQSMPAVWQGEFVRLLEELQDAAADLDVPEEYSVQAKQGGRFIADPFRDYERGRRRMPLKLPDD